MTRQEFIAQIEGTQRAFRGFLTALCCGDSAMADDIAQEAYMKAYMACDSFKNPEKFKAWIYRIGYTTFIDGKRSARPHVSYDDAKDVTDDSSSPHQQEERYHALYAALERLSANERTAILLFYMQDYSIREIAGIVHATESAVKQHLSRGRQHLRGMLETRLSEI